MSSKKEEEKDKAYEDPSETYNFEKVPTRNQTRHLYIKLGAGGTGSSEEQHSMIIKNADLRLTTTMNSDSLPSVNRSNSVETTSLIHIETQSRKSEISAEKAERNTTATAVKEKLTESGP